MNIYQRLKEKYDAACAAAKRVGFGLDTLIVVAAAGFFMACFGTVEYTTFGSSPSFEEVDVRFFWLLCVLTWAFLAAAMLALRDVRISYYCLGIFAVLLAAVYGLELGDSLWSLLGVDFVLLLIFRFLWSKKLFRGSDRSLAQPRQSAVSFGLTVLIFLAFVVAVGWFATLRYKLYISPTFDFGIFAQLFEQMAKTGLPYTTLERSTYFSHFGVHFSPILYLLLPGYMIFRTPEYLVYAQAFCVGLGVFPVWLICREFHFSPRTCFLGALLYLLIPSVGLGCFKDFHENKLLAVLILWLIYFYIKKKYAGVILFSLLTMAVKEDAAIYTASIGLWMFFYTEKTSVEAAGKKPDEEGIPRRCAERFRRWLTPKRFGMILFLFSVGYFVAACAIVNSYGMGTLITRYSDYLTSADGSFVDVIKTCLYHFGYMLQMVFTEEKMEYVLWMLVPVAFLPFRNRRISIWLLFVPMLLVNILPNWIYQYDISFQYTYGVAALALVAAFFTIRGWSRPRAEFAIFLCVVLCVPLFMGTTVSKSAYYNSYWDEEHQETYALTEDALTVIPEGASVTASTTMAAHLYWVDELYTIPDYYGSLQRTDYYVISYATDYSDQSENPWDIVEEGYELVLKQGKVAIYRRVD